MLQPHFEGKIQMPETIQAGTILIKDGALFPKALVFESEPYSPGWKLVKGLDGYALDRKAHQAGWTFFYLAGEGRATVFGREGQETVRKAIKRILADMKSENCNSLEITRVAFKHFLGVPCATVSFHLRNMQESMFLSGSDVSHAWKDESLVAA
jgi:hypothetical protein